MTCKSELCFLESDREEMEKFYSRALKKEIHLQGFEEEVEHKTKYTSGKASYVERNQAMIDLCDFCVFYFDEHYLPPLRLFSKHSSPYQPRSGTALAFKYAKRKKKHIINMFDFKNTTNNPT